MTKGANAPLPPHAFMGGHIDIALEWRVLEEAPEVDLSAVLVNADGRVRSDADLVFYNQPAAENGAVRHLGKARGAGLLRDVVRLRLADLPNDVTAVFVAASTENGPFAAVTGLRLTMTDAGDVPLITYEVSGTSTEQAILVGEVYRRAGAWKLRAVGQGWADGLAGLVTHFGIDVDDEQDSASPTPHAPPARTLPDAPPSTAPAAPSTPMPPPAPAGVPALPPPPAPEPSPPSGGRRGLFGPRKKQLAEDNARLASQLAHFGAMDALDVQRETDRRRDELRVVEAQLAAARAELQQVQSQLVAADDDMVLQEVGVYRYKHPLDDSVAYKARLADLKDQIKVATKGQNAVLAATNWTVNGSAREGAAMVRDFSKLMLRAYNAEADNAVRTVRPHTLHTATDRLEKAAATIAKLGKSMLIRVSPHYHGLRLLEVQLTADYLAKVEEERERIREQRERQREEEKAQREFEREKARLLKERAHYEAVLARARASGDLDAITDLQSKLDDVDTAIFGVEAREAKIRAGYVYVISNIGAFGEHMVKIGMTRRLDPMDRVRELGDASVPFRFDVHALIFSEDAVSLENTLHEELKDRRVNRVNQHREFFYATPAEVRDVLARRAGQHLLEYKEAAEALEWRASGERALPTPHRLTY
nr:DUF4041 domain-containing protein [Motilibacter aurantiacus]